MLCEMNKMHKFSLQKPEGECFDTEEERRKKKEKIPANRKKSKKPWVLFVDTDE